MPALQDMTPLEQTFQQELRKTRKLVQQQTSRLWNLQETYYEKDIPYFIDKLEPLVLAGERHAVELTTSYLTEASGYNINQLLQVSADDIIPTLRGGLAPEALYTRAFQTVWNGLANKLPVPEAIRRGGERLISATGMNVSLAFQATGPAFAKLNNPVLAKAGAKVIIGYERTSAPDCCDFCMLVDGAFCYSQDALPLHNNCGCTLSPVMGTQEQLDRMDARREDDKDKEEWLFQNDKGEWVPNEGTNKRDAYVLTEHPEMGPYLSSRVGDKGE